MWVLINVVIIHIIDNGYFNWRGHRHEVGWTTLNVVISCWCFIINFYYLCECAFASPKYIYIYIYICVCVCMCVCVCACVCKNTDFWLSGMPLFYLLVEQCDSYLLLTGFKGIHKIVNFNLNLNLNFK